MRRRGLAIVVLLMIILLLIAAAIWVELDNRKTAPPVKVPPTVVQITQVKSESWPKMFSTTGVISSWQGITVRAEAAGRVTSMYVDSGQQVKAGQPLFQINPATLNAQLSAAQAQLTLAEASYTQQKKLYISGNASMIAFDRAKSAYQSAQDRVSQLMAELDLTKISAPVSGTLGLRLVKLGDYVTVGAPLIHLRTNHTLRLDFSVPQSYLLDLKLGQTVDVKSDALPGQTLTGKIYAINSSVNENGRAIDARAILKNQMNRTISGVFCYVVVNLSKNRQVNVVPQTAVGYDINGAYVYRVVNGLAIQTPVKLGDMRGDDVAVLAGLKAGDDIVGLGEVKVHDKAPVVASPASEGKAQ